MNNKMQVFKAEKEAGLEHLIRSTAAIAYHSPVLLEQEADPVTFSKDITSLKRMRFGLLERRLSTSPPI